MTESQSAISRQDAEEYTQSLGQITAGAWRQIALASRLGVPEALGLSTREWVDQRLGGYVRLSISERREAVGELTAERVPTREIGEVLGVDQRTVQRDVATRAASELEPEPEPEVAAPAEPTTATHVASELEPEPTEEGERERLDQMADQLDDDGAIARARLVRDFHAGCRAFTRDLLPLNTEALAEALADDGDRYAAGSLIHQMRGWLDQLDRTLHGLKVIQGGRT